MADTYSPNLRVRLPETGQYANTWGTTLNSDALTLLDQAIAGQKAINIGAAVTYSLAALTNGAAADSRYFSLLFSGSPAGAVTVTVPASVTKKIYLVDNQTGQTLTFTYGGAGTVTLGVGERRFVWCDGTNCYGVTSTATDSLALGGVVAANYARLDASQSNSFLSVNRYPWVTVTEGPTTTIDAKAGQHQILTLTGNRILAAPANAADGRYIELLVLQDGTGGRLLTWDGIFTFENCLTPTLAPGANKADLFRLDYNVALGKWSVRHAFNIGSPGGGSALTYIIAENTQDWNLLAKTGVLGAPSTITITVNPGVIVQASCAATPAMDLMGMPAGSTINLIIIGAYAIGKGGDGGDGGALMGTAGQGLGNDSLGENGKPGGHAIKGPGAAVILNITNTNGYLWGGGGGGVGGSFIYNAGGVDQAGGGGGGGGGAGGGRGGRAGGVKDASGTRIQGSDGGDGSAGPLGTKGLGGAKTQSGSPTAVYLGGDGGLYGAPGAQDSGAGGVVGAAGKAVDKQGGTVNISVPGAPNVLGAVS